MFPLSMSYNQCHILCKSLQMVFAKILEKSKNIDTTYTQQLDDSGDSLHKTFVYLTGENSSRTTTTKIP